MLELSLDSSLYAGLDHVEQLSQAVTQLHA